MCGISAWCQGVVFVYAVILYHPYRYYFMFAPVLVNHREPTSYKHTHTHTHTRFVYINGFIQYEKKTRREEIISCSCASDVVRRPTTHQHWTQEFTANNVHKHTLDNILHRTYKYIVLYRGPSANRSVSCKHPSMGWLPPNVCTLQYVFFTEIVLGAPAINAIHIYPNQNKAIKMPSHRMP